MNKKQDFKAAVGVVISNNGSVLLGKSAHEDDRKGKWIFPGGKRDKHETPQATAIRETFEETNIVCKVLSWDFIIEHPDKPGVQYILLTPAIPNQAIKFNSEFTEMDWFPILQPPKEQLFYRTKDYLELLSNVHFSNLKSE